MMLINSKKKLLEVHGIMCEHMIPNGLFGTLHKLQWWAYPSVSKKKKNNATTKCEGYIRMIGNFRKFCATHMWKPMKFFVASCFQHFENRSWMRWWSANPNPNPNLSQIFVCPHNKDENQWVFLNFSWMANFDHPLFIHFNFFF
jgi:hypothetical protein